MERDSRNPQENRSREDLFVLNAKVMKNQMSNAGVLDVELDSEFLPRDIEYLPLSNEDLFYDEFIITHTFSTKVEDSVDIQIDDEDVFKLIGDRFDIYVDHLSKMFKLNGDKKNSLITQNLTLIGASRYAKKRYSSYLIEFIDNEVGDPIGASRHVIYWSEAHLVLDASSKLPDLDPNLDLV